MSKLFIKYGKYNNGINKLNVKRDNKNANSTGKYWLLKVFEVLKENGPTMLTHFLIYLKFLQFLLLRIHNPYSLPIQHNHKSLHFSFHLQ